MINTKSLLEDHLKEDIGLVEILESSFRPLKENACSSSSRSLQIPIST